MVFLSLNWPVAECRLLQEVLSAELNSQWGSQMWFLVANVPSSWENESLLKSGSFLSGLGPLVSISTLTNPLEVFWLYGLSKSYKSFYVSTVLSNHTWYWFPWGVLRSNYSYRFASNDRKDRAGGESASPCSIPVSGEVISGFQARQDQLRSVTAKLTQCSLSDPHDFLLTSHKRDPVRL